MPCATAWRFGLMLVVALMHPTVWLALAWPIYIVSLLLLVAVDVVGKIGMGAQRWLVLGPMQIQPSEITKVAVILVLARYYHGLSKEQAARFLYILPPLAVILAPVALVMVQPDLGTAMMVLLGGSALLFVAGVRLWMFLGARSSPPSAACRSPGRSCTNTSASGCSPSSIPTAIRWARAITSPSRRSPSARAACSARASSRAPSRR